MHCYLRELLRQWRAICHQEAVDRGSICRREAVGLESLCHQDPAGLGSICHLELTVVLAALLQ